MSELPKAEGISISRGQALGLGGAGVLLTLVLNVQGMFYSRQEGENLDRRIVKVEAQIEKGFSDARGQLKDEVSSLRELLIKADSNRWTKTDHLGFRRDMDNRLERLENRIIKIEDQ